jgi:hypothetical protein
MPEDDWINVFLDNEQHLPRNFMRAQQWCGALALLPGRK